MKLSKFVEDNFFMRKDETFSHCWLCNLFSFPTESGNDWARSWKEYFHKWNRLGVHNLGNHLEREEELCGHEEKAFYRLLIIEDFKLWLDEKGVKYE